MTYPSRVSRALREQRHHTLFAHFANCIMRALAAKTAVLRSTIRHHVNSGARCLIDMHASNLQLAGRSQRGVELVGENPGREPERSGIHSRYRLAQRVKGCDAHDRPEDLLTTERRGLSNIRKQGRRNDGTTTVSSD